MSEQTQTSGRAAFLQALNVRRNALAGFAFALLVTLAVFGFFVVIPGTYRSVGYYLALAFVLVLSLGGLATVVLTLFSAIRLAREV